jgi:hypothetical protein
MTGEQCYCEPGIGIQAWNSFWFLVSNPFQSGRGRQLESSELRKNNRADGLAFKGKVYCVAGRFYVREWSAFLSC